MASGQHLFILAEVAHGFQRAAIAQRDVGDGAFGGQVTNVGDVDTALSTQWREVHQVRAIVSKFETGLRQNFIYDYS